MTPTWWCDAQPVNGTRAFTCECAMVFGLDTPVNAVELRCITLGVAAPHCVSQLSSPRSTVGLVPGCCWAYFSFSVTLGLA